MGEILPTYKVTMPGLDGWPDVLNDLLKAMLEADPCESAKFNLIDYFSTQDLGINIQSSIF